MNERIGDLPPPVGEMVGSRLLLIDSMIQSDAQPSLEHEIAMAMQSIYGEIGSLYDKVQEGPEARDLLIKNHREQIYSAALALNLITNLLEAREVASV